MDMFWNKRFSILKFSYIFVAMLPKFFYTHTYKSQVLQRFLSFIIFKTIIKFVQYGLRMFAGFVYSGILLLRSIWWNLKRRGSVRRRLRRMNMWRRTLLRSLFSWLILKRRGSVRRFQRMNIWRTTLLMSLFTWLILKTRGSVRRFQRMKIWRRTLLRSLFIW
jgi:ribosomal protein L39E